ncbi:MAG: hypothetical protein U9R19_18440, partial [Bacteroidota bacterium]|nr:hypothetical protein [Bacteroidota bacterium]
QENANNRVMLIFKLSHPSADGLLCLKISQALFLTLSYQRLLKTGVFVQALYRRFSKIYSD